MSPTSYQTAPPRVRVKADSTPGGRGGQLMIRLTHEMNETREYCGIFHEICPASTQTMLKAKGRFKMTTRLRHGLSTIAIDTHPRLGLVWAHTLTEEVPMRIRAAVPADCRQILRFIRDLAHYEKLLHEVTATEDQLKEHLFGPQPKAEVILVEENNIPVGFALYFTSFSTFVGKPGLYLEDLFVLPEFRKKAYGKALLASLAQEVVKRGYARLEWAVLDWNLPAIQFYETLGAEPMADWITYRLHGENLQRLADSLPKP